MFGIKLNDEVQVNIGDMYNDFLEKVNRFLEANQDTLWAELEELEDEMLSTVIRVYSKGPVVPYVEVTFTIIDEIVATIEIAGSNLFKKLVIEDKEFIAEGLYNRYRKNFVDESFCSKYKRVISQEEAVKTCKYASKNDCNIGCDYCQSKKRQVELQDGEIIVDISKSGFENLVIGKDMYGKPIYSSVTLEYNGMGLSCYTYGEKGTVIRA